MTALFLARGLGEPLGMEWRKDDFGIGQIGRMGRIGQMLRPLPGSDAVLGSTGDVVVLRMAVMRSISD